MPARCPFLRTSTVASRTRTATRPSTPHHENPGARSSAAPTAGLHFTPELLDSCRKAGAEVLRVDLAIGIDTFRPITAASVEGHLMHSERYSVPEETLAACLAAERVVAVGTTSVRALEAAAASGVLAGRTDLYIRGEYPFRLVDVLITNFHMPCSSLLVLVDAFAGRFGGISTRRRWRRVIASSPSATR